MGRRDEGARAFRIFAEPVDLVQSAWTSRGIVAVWIYAAIRPRFGAGPRTAIYAGLAVWVVGALLPNLSFMCFGGLFSRHLTLYTTLGALVELVAGTVAGAALYKEA